MIKMLKLHGSNNYQVIYSGPLGKQYLKQLKNQMLRLRQDNQKIGLIAEMDEVPRIKGLKSIVELIKMKTAALKVISKYAIVTSKQWLQKMVRLADWLTPGIEVRVFPEQNRQLALAWLNEERS